MIEALAKVFIGDIYAYEARDADAIIKRALNEKGANPYALTVWESARVAVDAIVKRAHRLGQNPRIVDVGSGTGALSLSLSAQGFSTLAIDIDQGALDLLSRAANEQSLSVDTLVLDAFAQTELFAGLGDWFVFADVLYEQTLAEKVARCSERLVAEKKCVCVLSPKRLGRDRFLKALSCEKKFSRLEGIHTKSDVQWCWLGELS